MKKTKNTQELNPQRTKCEVYSRVVGYIRPVQNWNPGKAQEFNDRTTYDKNLTGCGC